MADTLPPVIAVLLADASQAEEVIDEFEAKLESLRGLSTDIPVGADTAEAQSELAILESELNNLSGNASLGVDDTELAAAIALANEVGDSAEEAGAKGTAAFSAMGAEVNEDTARILLLTAALNSLPTEKTVNVVYTSTGVGEGGGGGGDLGLLAALGFGGGGGGGGFLSTLMGAGATLGSVGSFLGLGAEHIVGTGIGILGSLAGAGLGAGFTALGAGGTMGVGLGTDLAGIGQAAGDIESTYSALTALNNAIATYGANSTQAATDQANLTSTLNGFSPAAQQAVLAAAQTAVGFHTMFDTVTAQAESTGAQIINQALQVGEKFLPTIGQFAAQNMSIMEKDLQPFFTWLQNPTGSGGLGIFTNLEKVFQQNLPTGLNLVTQGFELLAKTVNIASTAGRPFLDEINAFVTKLNTTDFGQWTSFVKDMMSDFQTWLGLAKSVGEVLYHLFEPAVGAGKAFAGMLTGVFNQIDGWLKSSTTQSILHGLFVAHLQQMIQGFGSVLKAVLPFLESFANAWMQIATVGAGVLTPILESIAAILRGLNDIPFLTTILGWAAAILLLGNSFRNLFGWIVNAVGNFAGFDEMLGAAAEDSDAMSAAVAAAAEEVEALGAAADEAAGGFGATSAEILALGADATEATGAVEALTASLDAAGAEGDAGLAVTAEEMRAVYAAALEASAGVEELDASVATLGAGGAGALGETTAEVGALGAESAATGAEVADVGAGAAEAAGGFSIMGAASGALGAGLVLAGLAITSAFLPNVQNMTQPLQQASAYAKEAGQSGTQFGNAWMSVSDWVQSNIPVVGGMIVKLGSAIGNAFGANNDAEQYINTYNTSMKNASASTKSFIDSLQTNTPEQAASSIQDLTARMQSLYTTQKDTSGSAVQNNTLATSELQFKQLDTTVTGLERTTATYNGNVATLGSTFGMTASQVDQAAQAAGVNLKTALNPLQVQQFSIAANQMGFSTSESFSQVASAATKMVQQTDAQFPLLQVSAQQAMTLFQDVMGNGGASAINKFVTGLQGGLPEAAAIYSQLFGGTVQQAEVTLFVDMAQAGNQSVLKFIASVEAQQGAAENAGENTGAAYSSGLLAKGPAAGAAGQNLLAAATAALNGGTGAASAAGAAVGAAFSSALSAAASSAVAGAQALVNAGISSIEAGAAAQVNAINAIPHTATTVPKAAAGGFVNSATLALVGEAGPELILPLNDPARMSELLGSLVGSSTGAPSSSPSVSVGGSSGGGAVVHTGDTHVHVYLDNDEVAGAITPQVRANMLKQARGTGNSLGGWAGVRH